jgi:hypothetical protein
MPTSIRSVTIGGHRLATLPLLTNEASAVKNGEEVIALLKTNPFGGMIWKPRLTELEAQVLKNKTKIMSLTSIASEGGHSLSERLL